MTPGLFIGDHPCDDDRYRHLRPVDLLVQSTCLYGGSSCLFELGLPLLLGEVCVEFMRGNQASGRCIFLFCYRCEMVNASDIFVFNMEKNSERRKERRGGLEGGAFSESL